MIRFLQFFVIFSFSVYSVEAQCRLQSHKFIGDLCYILSNDKLTFQDALNSCHQVSTQLAVIHTTTQANHLATLVRKQSDNSNDLFWIGLSRQTVNSRFQWDDGTDMYFSNFDSNFQKDNLYVVESTVNGKWRTLDGHEPLPFVCSYVPSTVPVTTPTPEPFDPTCTPQSNSTYLFAYSNDIDPQIVSDSINEATSTVYWGGYEKFGAILFDVKNLQKFQFFNDLRSLNQSVLSNLPNPSLGFGNNQTGSDILDVLQRFLYNTDGAPLCGAKIVILLKRHPLKTDTSRLLSQLQYHHVFIRTLMSNTPILGENYQLMYNLSGLTNGFASFIDDGVMKWDSFYFSVVLYNYNQIYSINPICKSGIERTDLPIFQVPSKQYDSDLYLEISLQDHGPLKEFEYLNVTITNTVNATDQIKLSVQFARYGTTLYNRNQFFRPNANYSVKLVTGFSNSVPENLQMRVWVDEFTPINYWLPFTNWN